MSPCQSDVSGLYVRARVRVSVSPRGNCNSLWHLKPGIRTHFGPSSPVPRSLDAGPSVATCTGSYSTHTGGMITSGCPGSSPRTPRRKRRSVKEGKSSVSSEDGQTAYRLKRATDLVFLQREQLVTCGATEEESATAVEGGETQPGHK